MEGVTPHALQKLDGELTTFQARLTEGMGRPERRAAMTQYVTGLLLDGERKSIERSRGEAAPTKFYLPSLPATTPLRTLVRLAKLRWRIERDDQEMKGELGLDHCEGRTWQGVHHHAALCAPHLARPSRM